MGAKRQRESQRLPVGSKKRQKVETAGHESANSDRVFNIDELNWKKVQLPDRLDDAGGFFGLEEIEGVEVVRPKGKGQIKFKATPIKPIQSILKRIHKAEAKENDSDVEWSGFSDDEPVKESQSPIKADASRSGPRKKDTEMEKVKPQRTCTASGNQLHRDIQRKPSFSALQEDGEADDVDVSAWDPLGVSPSIQTSLSKLKFPSPTPIQKAAIPQILAGHDVIGKAATGSGKTLTFGIPILEYLLDQKKGNHAKNQSTASPVALILSPTRELAHQLLKHISDINAHAPGVDARVALLTGGLSIQKQQRLLVDADILVGTPGRVWEILSMEHGLIEKMKQIKFLVVDEADRLLSEGHFQEVEEILNSLDRTEDGGLPEDDDSQFDDKPKSFLPHRQTLVFSATFHKGLQQKLAGKGRFIGDDLMDKQASMEYLLKKLNFREERPIFIDVNPVSQMADGLREGIVECVAGEKDLYLYTLLLYHLGYRALVFANSISSVRRLTQFLQNLGIPALGLHSSMEQKARLRSVERFSVSSASANSVLVATDVAARGLDIKGIDLVIHYHVPRTADSYVHRSGRTARAGAPGKSVLICAPEEVVGVTRLVAKVHAAAKSKQNTKRIPFDSLELDRRIISRVRPRVTLSKRITESTLAKEKLSTENDWLHSAAEELGVDYDSEEFEQQVCGKAKGRGRGGGRHQRDKQAGAISKAELAAMKAELKQLLSKRINIGVSERYITSGRVDIDAILRGSDNGAFLGQVDTLDF
ncbi:P-loop containing nucleoside triphosphate hydrolase protein [Elaphomyces granulatus]